MTDRVPPHDLHAERSLLGAVLVNPDVFATIADVTPELFYRRGHGVVWKAYQRLVDRQQAIDFTTLRAQLEAASELDEAGGVAYLAGLIDGVPRAVNAEHYGRIVREKATLRRLIQQAHETLASAYDGGDDVDAIVDAAEARLMDVGRQATGGDYLLASDWMARMGPRLERAVKEKRDVTGLATGFARLDRATRGFQPGTLTVVAARPSMGKTALTLQIASTFSQQAMTAYESLEMDEESMGWRRLALESRIDAYRMQTGRVTGHEISIAADALNRIGETQFAISDSVGLSCSAVCAKMRRFAAKHGLGAAFIDYLQLMTSGERSENRTQDIGVMARRLKALARDLRIPLVVLSQLTRDNEREKRPPRLSDLREGGDIEQAADVVLFIHRPQMPQDRQFADDEVIDLIVAKNRNGPAGQSIPLGFHGPTVRFFERADS